MHMLNAAHMVGGLELPVLCLRLTRAGTGEGDPKSLAHTDTQLSAWAAEVWSHGTVESGWVGSEAWAFGVGFQLWCEFQL